MGRRYLHSAEDLRELVLNAATQLIESDGLSGLSAREIARRIGYSPGTLYNIFESIDDLVATVETRVIDRLSDRLAMLPTDGGRDVRVCRLAADYLAFALENPQLWNMLHQHQPPHGSQPSGRVSLGKLVVPFREALVRELSGHGDGDRENTAAALWLGLHGLSILATTGHITAVSESGARELADVLVRRYLAGLPPEPGGPRAVAATAPEAPQG